MLIYVCGKSGSGKSTFAIKLAESLGFNYIDIDKIGHAIYEDKELINELSKLFNTSLYNEENKFDRKLLGNALFNEQDKSKIEAFNNLTWTHMKKHLEPYLTQDSVLDYLMLPLTDIWNLKAIKILIKSQNEEDRLNKILERDKITKEYLLLREKNAPTFNQNQFHFIISHDYTMDFTNQAIVIANTIKNMKGDNL